MTVPVKPSISLPTLREHIEVEPDRSPDAASDSVLVGNFAAAASDGPALSMRSDCIGNYAGRGEDRPQPVPCPAWKRSLDVLGALLGLVLLLPCLIGVATMIKWVSRGPLFFKQQRYGVGGKPFLMWKFRTIESQSAGDVHRRYVDHLKTMDQPMQKIDHQLRVIKGGKWLRRWGVDELPQLVNVLRGDMSLVGPRPDVVPYEEYEPWQRRRFDVLPGITGLWQVSGKNSTTFATMMRMDVDYVERRSFWLDLAILLKTAPALMRD